MKPAFIYILGLLVAGVIGCNDISDHRPALASDEPKSIVNTDEKGVALQGYDPVAYFTDNRPVKGDPAITARYKRATYYFANDEHRKLFEANPSKYEPQFGGYCGYAASINKISPINPDFFQVLDGRLVLQHNQKAWDLWNKDVKGNLASADKNWPALVQTYGN
jgi:YHS domain-containing protein